jgi:hypothetical protein
MGYTPLMMENNEQDWLTQVGKSPKTESRLFAYIKTDLKQLRENLAIFAR